MTIALLLMSLMSVPASQLGAEVAADAQSIHPLLPGMKAPMVSVTSPNGEPISLADLYSQRPTAVIFYRGGW